MVVSISKTNFSIHNKYGINHNELQQPGHPNRKTYHLNIYFLNVQVCFIPIHIWLEEVSWLHFSWTCVVNEVTTQVNCQQKNSI